MKITVLKKEVGFPARIELIEDSLEGLQKAVGGYIECVNVDRGICVVCNEEGRINGMRANTIIDGEVYYGDIIIAATDKYGEGFANVSSKIVNRYMNLASIIE